MSTAYCTVHVYTFGGRNDKAIKVQADSASRVDETTDQKVPSYYDIIAHPPWAIPHGLGYWAVLSIGPCYFYFCL